MAPCCIKGCDNRGEKRSKKNSGITYHLFPRDAVKRRSWLQALGRTHWQPSNASVVCSDHFQPSYFYLTQRGLKRLREEAVPDLNLHKQVVPPRDELLCRLASLASLAEGRGASAGEVESHERLETEKLARSLVPDMPPLAADDTHKTKALATQLVQLALIYEKQKKKLRNLRQKLRRNNLKLDSLEKPLALAEKKASRREGNDSIVNLELEDICSSFVTPSICDPTEDPLVTL